MVVADALDVAGPLVDQAEERADVLRPLGKLREEGVAFGLAGGLRGRLLLALASTEHGTSWRGSSTAHAATERESSAREIGVVRRNPVAEPMVRTRHC